MTAKEMFEKLGYEYDEDEKKIVVCKVAITGTRIYKYVFHKTDNKKFRIKLYESFSSIEELKAINKQIEELGWDNESNNYRN